MMTDSYDIYLVLHQVRDRADQYREMVSCLARLDRAFLPRAELFYRAATDTALLVLNFSPHALSYLGEDSIHLLAHRTKLPMLVPSRLSPQQRRRFFRQHLSTYEVYLAPHASDHAVAASAPPAPAEPPASDVEMLMRALQQRLASIPAAELASLGRDAEHTAGAHDTGDSPFEFPLFQPWWQQSANRELSSARPLSLRDRAPA
ncbi:MAG: hypothetical protein Tsb0020_54660 [Haliangiales bacterium]